MESGTTINRGKENSLLGGLSARPNLGEFSNPFHELMLFPRPIHDPFLFPKKKEKEDRGSWIRVSRSLSISYMLARLVCSRANHELMKERDREPGTWL